jgi:signal transduction histidine kinase
MLLQHDPDVEPKAGDPHGRRLQALKRGVRDYGQALERESETSVALAEPPSLPPPAPKPKPAGPLQQHPFLAHVSHEMRAPLNGMLGMTSLLLLSDLDDRQRRLATLAQNSAEVLLRLVNDILDLARMESGHFRLDPQPFAFASMVSQAVEMFRAETDRKRLSLTLEFAPGLPRIVLGDALRVRQILSNLIGNAVKFTPKGEVAISVTRLPGGALRFEVRDTGKGISEAAQAKLFTEFMQEDASTAREHGGTGLGLAVSRQLVRLMQGEIGVRSATGVGSSFWFEVVLPNA